jgi:hypothetical protein
MRSTEGAKSSQVAGQRGNAVMARHCPFLFAYAEEPMAHIPHRVKMLSSRFTAVTGFGGCEHG